MAPAQHSTRSKIQRLDITNLRAFSGEHRVELRPITLIYGPNSAGKSSIIKTLCLLKQTLAAARSTAREGRPPLLLEGPIVDLGSFTNVIHRHDTTAELGFGVQFSDPADDRRSVYAGLRFKTQREARKAAGPHRGAGRLDPAAAALAYQTAAVLGGGGFAEDARVRFERNPYTHRFSLAAGERKHLATLMASRVRELRADHRTTDADAAELMRRELDRLPRRQPLSFLDKGFFPALPDGATFSNQQTEKRYGAWFAETMYERSVALDDLLERLSYLGPSRAAPSRFQVLSRAGERATHVGPTGEHVTRLLADPSRDAVVKVNAWLKRLDIDYTIEVRPVKSGVDFEIGDLYATSLIDRRGTRVSPQDVGFGISQVLPVVVELLVNTNAVVCIEQPEIHIHPRLQVRLGDLLLESVGANGNQVIVESHSEHLLLRLQRRIREPMERPEYRWFTNEHVIVNYVRTDATGAVPEPLGHDEQGELTREWPGGFFEEGYAEVWS